MLNLKFLKNLTKAESKNFHLSIWRINNINMNNLNNYNSLYKIKSFNYNSLNKKKVQKFFQIKKGKFKI
jgi:hypothetical protein